ncbi:immobilization antigen (macronuclear) [Tetrahymena thermophila SB210]|uniref:Immobilization antigen n=1 Tax=Tetrahymena thermophila (strain SB210) TaxID=312017 RepID=Q231Z6_TETTS|nr:immobilization antigen [Tetrahymena thermophila SB210]EAR91304.1 immobilization antigen [Tetrahymena thermophila SB210]|eukprot:XP_001011549.1 immobilization antigen [Tetrahymena thermophila SB210]
MSKFLVLATLLALTGFSHATVTCGQGAIIDPGDNTKCFCPQGFYGDPLKYCQSCPGNSFSHFTVNSINVQDCNICKDGYYVQEAATDKTAAICTKCSGFTTPKEQTPTSSSNESVCNACMDGYYYLAGPINNSLVPTCVQCPPYSGVQGILQSTPGFCTCYDSGANALSSTVTSCTCKSGQGTPIQTPGSTSTCIPTTTSNSSSTASNASNGSNAQTASNAVILSTFTALLSFVFII